MIDPKKLKEGDVFWSFDWGRAWWASIALVSELNIAYMDGKVIKTVYLDKCFLTEVEAYEKAASEALNESHRHHKWFQECMEKIREIRERNPK